MAFLEKLNLFGLPFRRPCLHDVGAFGHRFRPHFKRGVPNEGAAGLSWVLFP